jgi:hypothetical protein
MHVIWTLEKLGVKRHMTIDVRMHLYWMDGC